MKVLMPMPYYEPEIVACSHLTHDIIEACVRENIEVDVIAPYPTRGISQETRKEYITDKKTEIFYDGLLKVRRFALFGEGKNPLLRALRYSLSIILQTVKCIGVRDADVLFVYSTPPINGLMMAVVKKFTKMKVVYNLQDIFPDSLVNTGLTKKDSLLWKIGRTVENITYRASDKIIVISKDFKKNILEKGVPEKYVDVVYNWVDENEVVSVAKEDNPLFEKYSLDRNKFYVCYSGNIGYTQNLDMLCRVAKRLEGEENIGFIIVGDGAYKEALTRIIDNNGIKNITLIPFQDYKDISYVFSLGDVGLIISKKGVGTNSVPSKTWSIMSASRPVLASFDKGSELDEIITSGGCGICVDADDEEALYNAILSLSESDNSTMGEAGRVFVCEHISKEKCTAKYVGVIKNVR